MELKLLGEWLRVDLESTQRIDAVRLYNRKDCCGWRLRGFEIRVGDSPTYDDNTACFTGGTAPTDWLDVACEATGRYVFVALPWDELATRSNSNDRVLTLCEVWVLQYEFFQSSAVLTPSGSSPAPTFALAMSAQKEEADWKVNRKIVELVVQKNAAIEFSSRVGVQPL